MIAVILTCVLLGAGTVYGDGKPFVKEVKCAPRDWPGYPIAKEWSNGRESIHEGFEPHLKAVNFKIADFFIQLIGRRGLDAAVFCDIETDVNIEAVWLDRSGLEDSESFIFGVENKKTHLRVGLRGKFNEHNPQSRVQIYGTEEPKKATVTCGGGPKGTECPKEGDNWNVVFKIRDQDDVA